MGDIANIISALAAVAATVMAYLAVRQARGIHRVERGILGLQRREVYYDRVVAGPVIEALVALRAATLEDLPKDLENLRSLASFGADGATLATAVGSIVERFKDRFQPVRDAVAIAISVYREEPGNTVLRAALESLEDRMLEEFETWITNPDGQSLRKVLAERTAEFHKAMMEGDPRLLVDRGDRELPPG